MIEARKYSTLKGPICNRDYNDAPSISWYFIANEFDFFFRSVQAWCLGEKEYQYPKTLNRKQRNV